MKIIDIIRLDEKSMSLDKAKKFATTHYPDAEDETEALLTFLVKSVGHAKDDDQYQNAEISNLKQQVSQIKQSKAPPTPIMPIEPIKPQIDIKPPKELK